MLPAWDEPSCACTVISLPVIFVTVPSTCLSVPCPSVSKENAKNISKPEAILRIVIPPLAWIRPSPRSRRLIQEFVFLFFFLYIPQTARIMLLHVLQIRVRQRWQMANEQYQMPRVVIVRAARTPRRHPGEAHA